jgi:hypothetical protein
MSLSILLPEADPARAKEIAEEIRSVDEHVFSKFLKERI